MIIEFWLKGDHPILCYGTNKKGDEPKRIPVKRNQKAKPKSLKKPVMVVDANGTEEEYESVVKAADAVGMNPNTLYAFLNGRAKNTTEYKIFKSQINN